MDSIRADERAPDPRPKVYNAPSYCENLPSTLGGERGEFSEHTIISRECHMDELLIGTHQIAAVQHLGEWARLQHRANRLQPVAPHFAVAHVKEHGPVV